MPDGEKPNEKDVKKPVAAEGDDSGGADEIEQNPVEDARGKVVPLRPDQPEEAFGDDDWREDEEDEEGPQGPRFPAWVRRLIVAVLVVALAGQAVAILPRIYNVDVIAFLKVARTLSQDERVQAYKEAIVVVDAAGRKGTGFNVDERGRIITNQHVIEGVDMAIIAFEDGRVFHARVLAEDAEADLAVLEPVDPPEEPFPALEVEASPSWSPDDPVYYIGNPLFFRHITGQGTVLGLANAGKPFPVMLIEAPIYPGNSGSPVITENGRVIGVIYASTELETGGRRVKAGLAIPASHPFLQETPAQPDGAPLE